FTAPVELGMRDRLKKAKLRIRLGLYDDETSEVCQWHVPETHFLETWGDARAFDGTVTIQQPLIQPLYNGRSALQTLQLFTEQPDTSPYDIVKNYWRDQHKGTDFEAWWRRAIHLGFIEGTALPAKTVAVKGDALSARTPAKTANGQFEVVFRPDAAVYDGRFANNGWLQEFPRPVTKITWDNAAFISPRDQKRLGITDSTGEMLKLTYQGRTLNAPVYVQPGVAEGSIVLHLGYGRTSGG